MTSDSTTCIGLHYRKLWIQAGTQRPELDQNTGRHFDTPLRLVTSRPSFRQSRHLASPNVSTIVHETYRFRYTWRKSWYTCVWKTLYLIFTLYLSASKFISGHFHIMASAVITWSGIGQASAYDWRNTPSESFDFHSQSQGRCWYVRTALETLSTQIGGEWSASRAKENYWTLLESEFDSGSTLHLFDTPGFDSMIATISWRQMHKTIIFCLNFARQSKTNHEQTCTQNRPKHPRVDS